MGLKAIRFRSLPTTALAVAPTMADLTELPNRKTANWTTLPANRRQLGDRWEHSHAAGAVLNLAALIALILSVNVAGERRGDGSGGGRT